MGVSFSFLFLSLGHWVSQHHREQQPYIFQGSCTFRSPAISWLYIFPSAPHPCLQKLSSCGPYKIKWGQSGSRGWGGKLLDAPHHGDAPKHPRLSQPHQQHPSRQEQLEYLTPGHGCCPHCLLCSGSLGVTDGSIYGIAVGSPASPTLIPGWQRQTIPLIHKTLRFHCYLCCPKTLGFRMVLIYVHKCPRDFVKNNRWHGVRGREAKAFFFLLQFLPKLCMSCVFQLMMKC